MLSCNPPIDERFSAQKALSSVTDDEFQEFNSPKPYKWCQILYQVLCFFVFLGPLRIVLAITSFVSFGIVVNIVRFTIRSYFGPNTEVGKGLCVRIAQIGFRIFVFCCGVAWIEVKGALDPKARFIVCNHTSIIDPFILLIQNKLTPVIKEEMSKVHFLKLIFENVDPVFVKRDRSTGASTEILERASNPKRCAVVAFPEGTCCGGRFMLKFHRGCFLSEYSVQPVAIRYWMPLMPKGWCDYAWKKEMPALQHFWNMMCMPFGAVQIDFLHIMSKKEDGKGDVEDFTTKAQLTLANHLKVQAIDRSSHQLFRKAKQECADQPH